MRAWPVGLIGLLSPLLCAGLRSWETYHLAEKGYSGPIQRPSEQDHQAVLCTAWSRVYHTLTTFDGLMPQGANWCFSRYLNIPLFIHPSLEGTYYGMALSVHPFVRSSVRPTVSTKKQIQLADFCQSTKKHRYNWQIFFKFGTQVCLGVPSINLLFILSCLIRYVHNVIHQVWRSHGSKKSLIWPKLGISGL